MERPCVGGRARDEGRGVQGKKEQEGERNRDRGGLHTRMGGGGGPIAAVQLTQDAA